MGKREDANYSCPDWCKGSDNDTENCVVCRSYGSGEKAGLHKGQESMRERAAKAVAPVWDLGIKHVERDIRSLPIKESE